MSEDVLISPEEYDVIAGIQQKILEKLVVNEPIPDILNALCLLAESFLPNAVASIMMIEPSNGLLSVMCAPSIPAAGHDALANLQPGVGGGSCGNAVFHNKVLLHYHHLNTESRHYFIKSYLKLVLQSLVLS